MQNQYQLLVHYDYSASLCINQMWRKRRYHQNNQPIYSNVKPNAEHLLEIPESIQRKWLNPRSSPTEATQWWFSTTVAIKFHTEITSLIYSSYIIILMILTVLLTSHLSKSIFRDITIVLVISRVAHYINCKYQRRRNQKMIAIATSTDYEDADVCIVS